jgi:hypothetical protein
MLVGAQAGLRTPMLCFFVVPLSFACSMHRTVRVVEQAAEKQN